jgi:hypothetical protein
MVWPYPIRFLGKRGHSWVIVMTSTTLEALCKPGLIFFVHFFFVVTAGNECSWRASASLRAALASSHEYTWTRVPYNPNQHLAWTKSESVPGGGLVSKLLTDEPASSMTPYLPWREKCIISSRLIERSKRYSYALPLIRLPVMHIVALERVLLCALLSRIRVQVKKRKRSIKNEKRGTVNETWLEFLAICDKGESLLSLTGTYDTVSFMRLYSVLRTVTYYLT